MSTCWCNYGCGHVCTTCMCRSAYEQMEMTECAAYSTHQPQYTTDVYEQVTTTNWIVCNTTACMFAWHSVCTTIWMLEMCVLYWLIIGERLYTEQNVRKKFQNNFNPPFYGAKGSNGAFVLCSWLYQPTGTAWKAVLFFSNRLEVTKEVDFCHNTSEMDAKQAFKSL